MYDLLGKIRSIPMVDGAFVEDKMKYVMKIALFLFYENML